jgi:hypothetical protein
MSEPVRKIRIRLKGATVHLRGPFDTQRIDAIAGCAVPVGDAHTIAIPPGQLFECEESEARQMIARFGGEIVP